METFILATQYLFWVGFVGMAAGTVYFLAERSSLPEAYRSTGTVAAIVTFIAAVHYYAMKVAVGTDGNIESLVNFPTQIRYIDWILTTPLLLVKFPILLGLRGDASKSLMTRLIVADLIMIIAGYFGEVSINAAGAATTVGWAGFGIAMVAWFYILKVLYTEVSQAAATQPASIQQGLHSMRTFILVGWAIYPVGFFLTLLNIADASLLMVGREFVYNIADLVNKVGFGLVAFGALRALGAQQKAA